MATLSTAASLLLSSLEEAWRDDGSSFFRLSDSAPSWAQETVREAHNGEFPNDSRYEAIKEALSALSEENFNGEDDAREALDDLSLQLLPIRTADLLSWFAAHNSRLGACDEALSSGRISDLTTYEILSEGWRVDCEEMLSSLISSLEENRSLIFNPDTDSKLLLADSHGIYIPQLWCAGMTIGDCGDFSVDWEDVKACQSGPDCEQYWDSWQSILDSAEFKEDGETWRLHQDGDLWAIRADAEIPEAWFA
jgi:hypothetical protein